VGSTNVAALRTAAAVAPAEIRTVAYEGIASLPHFNPDEDREGDPVAEAVAGLRAAVRSADALLICTPEYAGALPGSFKNLLEWTVGDAGTYRKPVAWINVSGPAAPSGGRRRARLAAQGAGIRRGGGRRGVVPANPADTRCRRTRRDDRRRRDPRAARGGA
jgi:NAD(P)H-dependent FMN reductase